MAGRQREVRYVVVQVRRRVGVDGVRWVCWYYSLGGAQKWIGGASRQDTSDARGAGRKELAGRNGGGATVPPILPTGIASIGGVFR